MFTNNISYRHSYRDTFWICQDCYDFHAKDIRPRDDARKRDVIVGSSNVDAVMLDGELDYSTDSCDLCSSRDDGKRYASLVYGRFSGSQYSKW